LAVWPSSVLALLPKLRRRRTRNTGHFACCIV